MHVFDGFLTRVYTVSCLQISGVNPNEEVLYLKRLSSFRLQKMREFSSEQNIRGGLSAHMCGKYECQSYFIEQTYSHRSQNVPEL